MTVIGTLSSFRELGEMSLTNAHRTCLAEDTFPPLFPDAMPTSRYEAPIAHR